MFKPYFQKLDSDGLDWVSECLSHGTLLSHKILSNTDLKSGEMVIEIAIPEHQEAIENRQNLHWGTAEIGKQFSRTVQIETLYHALKRLEEKRGPIAIIVEDNFTAGSPKIDTALADQLYEVKDDNHYLNIQTLRSMETYKGLSKHIGYSIGYPLNVFIILQKDIPKDKNLGDSVIDNLASSVFGIVNFAYDAETFTVWLKEFAGMRP